MSRTEELRLGAFDVELSNTGKVLFPAEEITKGDLVAAHPDRMTTEQRKDKRGDRVSLDILRNAYAQTVVTPYSVRACPGAYVSTPLTWQVIDDDTLAPDRFTMTTTIERLSDIGDPGPAWDAAAMEWALSASACSVSPIASRGAEQCRPRSSRRSARTLRSSS